ncbi:MAG: SIS domain-containing protein [bacterium]
MNDDTFLKDYFGQYHRGVDTPGIQETIKQLRDTLVQVRDSGKKVILAGNGASASIASHFALDYTKQGGVRSMAFNDAALITAYGNDYGYELWVAKAIEHHGDSGDLAILISSSGRSPNMVRAAETAKEMGITVITFTGFAVDNPLKSLGDINFWLDSRAYNIVEAAHTFWLAAVCDLLIGKSEYSVS